MATNGWISIRGLPIPKRKRLKRKNDYNKVTEKFFKKHKLCTRCDGRGYTLEEDVKVQDEVINLKYEGFKDLEKLKENGDVHLGDKMKQILQTEFCGRKPCRKCYGSGFTKKAKVQK